jgi:hypothetical protein
MLDAEEGDDQFKMIEIDPELISNFSPVMLIEVDLSISAQLNVKRYFEIKKKSAIKELKTKQAADIVIK